MKIGKKLMLSFIGIALLVGVVGYVGMTSLQKTKEINHKLSISIIPGTFEMYKIMSAIESLKTWTLVYILRGNIVRNGKTIKEWLQKDKDLIDETSRAHIENNFPLNTKQNYSREFEDKFKKLNTITNEIINLKNQGISVDELTKKMEKDYRPVYFPLLKLLKKHLAEHSQLQKEMESNLTKVFNRSVKIITITIFITLVLAIGTGLLISRSISRPILKLKTAAAEIGHGKLDTVIDIKSNDEIGILARSVEEMAANLSRTTTSVTNLENEITKRKKAQEQLEVFKYYFNSSIQGFGYATLDTKAILVNDTLLKLLSLNSKEDIIGKSFMLYYTDESKIKLENEVIPLILNEGSWSGELDMVQTTGKIIFTHESLFLIRDNEGNPNYIAVVITDITERKNYELKLQNNAEGEQAKNEELQTTNEELVKTYGELHESNEKYKLLSDAVAYSINAVAITDLSGKFTYINPSFEKMFGYSSNEAVDMTIPQFLPKKEFKKLTEEILPAVKKKGGYVGEIVCMKKDKSEFTVSSSTSLIKDINGKPTAMMGSFIDITEQKQAQKEAGETVVAVAAAEVERAKAKELGKAYIQLEKIQNANINITADLDRRRIAAISAAESEKKKADELAKAYRELREAQAVIIRSEKLAAIGLMSSSIAHELRNPLGVMKNTAYYLNMLDVSKNDPDVKENLNVLTFEIERSDKIITDLLNFTRTTKPALHPGNINFIVKDILNKVKIESGIKVITELGDALPDIEMDGQQIQQVFYNIATNAVQSMKKGGRLVIKTGLKEGFLEVSFADTGCGISKDDLAKVFEPLFSTKTYDIGLGLSLCSMLIEGHGGKIKVESEVDKGTTFTVKLPATAENAKIAKTQNG